MKIGRVKKNLGMGKLFIAALFLFNPNFVIIDLLPDFIGYAFLLWGIYQLSDLNYHFEEAARNFKKLIIVSLAQALSVLFVFGFLTHDEQDAALMLFCFTFGILEIIFLIPAYKAFFEGFIYLGSRHESTAIFRIKERKILNFLKKLFKETANTIRNFNQKRKEKKAKHGTNPATQKNIVKKEKIHSAPKAPRPRKNATEKIAKFTFLFVCLKPAITFAPEILGLVESPYYIDYSKFVDAFRALSLMILIPLSFVWLFKFIRYIRSIIKDKPFINELSEKYTAEVTPKTFLFTQRYIKIAFAFLSVAIAFNIDFYIDNSSILPDFISPIILFGMLIVVGRIGKVPLISYIFTGGYFASSLLVYIKNRAFFTEHTLSKSYFIPEAYNAFVELTRFRLVDSVLFVLMIISILPILSKIIKENTGFAPISSGNFYAEEKIKYIHAMLKKRLIITGILAGFAGASSITYALLVRSTERVKWLLYIWVVEFIVYIIFTVYFISTLNDIAEEMDYKYMLS